MIIIVKKYSKIKTVWTSTFSPKPSPSPLKTIHIHTLFGTTPLPPLVWTSYMYGPIFNIFDKNGQFWGIFDPPWGGWVGVKKSLQKMKLLIHTLLTSHKPSSLYKFWARYKLFRQKGAFLGVFLTPPEEGEGEVKKILQKNETPCPYASNKP